MKTLKSVNSIQLSSTIDKLWDILTQPDWTEKYMYNCRLKSDLTVGSSIDWVGEFHGQKVHLIGEVLDIQPPNLLKYTIIDPALHDQSNPANFIHITYEVREQNGGLLLTVVNETFDGNEERMQHIIAGWEEMVFPAIKTLAEE